jgi:molecular chaperone Hsp33
MMYRMLGEEGAVRILVVDVTAIADETCRRHEVPQDLRHIVAESTVVHALLGLYMKGEEELTLNVRLDRPEVDYLGQMQGSGNYRARVNLPDADVAASDQGALVGGMMVMKSLAARVLHQGVSLVHHRSLEDAFRAHLVESLQVDVVLRVGVDLSADGVAHACGVLIERLPAVEGSASLDTASFHERFDVVATRPERETSEELLAGSLFGRPVESLETRALTWRCQCSEERTEAVLSLLGHQDLLALADEQEEAQITCHFCCTTWSVASARIRELAAGLEALEG